jgi:hypothetical protein
MMNLLKKQDVVSPTAFSMGVDPSLTPPEERDTL